MSLSFVPLISWAKCPLKYTKNNWKIEFFIRFSDQMETIDIEVTLLNLQHTIQLSSRIPLHIEVKNTMEDYCNKRHKIVVCIWCKKMLENNSIIENFRVFIKILSLTFQTLQTLWHFLHSSVISGIESSPNYEKEHKSKFVLFEFKD